MTLEEEMHELAEGVRTRQTAARVATAVAHKGEAHGRARLSDLQVRTMRLSRTAGESLKVLAARYGVSVSTISRVCGGSRWSHV
jgi:hypothetical protein